MRRLILAGARAILVGGCSKAGEHKEAAVRSSTPAAAALPPVAAGFSHQPRFDAFGYYSADREVKAGELRLSVLAVGDEQEFRSWEVGDRRATYAPVMFVFDGAPGADPALQAEGAGAPVRVLPTAYAVSETEVRFEGADPALGRVSFKGALDRKALAAAQADPSGSSAVLTGTLQVGAQRYENLKFTWFGGD
jgi:hypothetical protein